MNDNIIIFLLLKDILYNMNKMTIIQSCTELIYNIIIIVIVSRIAFKAFLNIQQERRKNLAGII